MFWDSTEENCCVCQCSRLMKKGLQLNGPCCKYNRQEDKENVPQNIVSSPLKSENDSSFYEARPNTEEPCHGSPGHCSHFPKERNPFEDCDVNSQDSGYSASFKSLRSQSYTTFGSLGSIEDEFLDISELDRDNNDDAMAGELSSLISGKIVSSDKKKSPEFLFRRSNYRRAISMVNENEIPSTSRVRSCLFNSSPTSPSTTRAFKRPEPPVFLHTPLMNKKSRIYSYEDKEEEASVSSVARPTLVRSFSEAAVSSEDAIKSALQRSSTEPDLIGDFTKSYCLPLISGRHQDLKSISPATLAQLMEGQFKDVVNSFKVIDCRYPYEYEGGHIAGAVNLYTKEQILEDLLNAQTKANISKSDNALDTKRDILVFHCEFSSERGPNLSRFLRNVDRIHNKEAYPNLYYPEIYLLEGGYKNFYEHYSKLCQPQAYLPMLHPNHSNDLLHFRAKSRTWNVDTRGRSNFKAISKRL